jgi:hypothetical protein
MTQGSGRRPVGLLVLAVFAAVAVFALAGGAAADSSRGAQPLAENLVEIKVADRAAIEDLMADAESVGAEFNDHYLRQNEDDGTVTVQVLGDDDQIAALHDMGYEILGTIEDEEAYWDRIAERLRAIEAERKADRYAKTGIAPDFNAFGLRAGIAATTVTSEITVNRVDYFQNYAGRFLSVEAHNAATVQQDSGPDDAGDGPTMVVTWDEGPGTEIGLGGPRTMSPYVDPDPAQDTYLYHRILIRIGAPGNDTPPRPSRVRIASSTGAVEEADVETWIGGGLPPHADDFQIGFHDRYMDPTEVYQRFEQLAAEFGGTGGIAELIDLPYKTNGYQRKAQVTMDPPGARMVVDPPSAAAGTYTVAQATYGPATPVAGVAGAYALVNDGTAVPTEGCSPLIGFPAGAIALVDRGNCNFTVKTLNAQAAGAVAVVVVNNVPGAPTAPGGTAPGITIPTVQVGQADGATIKAGLPASGRVFGATPTSNASRVVLTSRAWGHEGGNDIKAQFVNPGAANSPLSVSVLGNEIMVSLATDGSGALSSTATQVVAAINAHPGAGALVKALTFQNNAGTGVVPATQVLSLSDFLAVSAAIPASGIPHDNSHVQRGPFQPKVMRIGKVRDGSKVGIYLFCQQHAREWVTPITCLETAERLLRNYATDPMTKDLVDNLDIFILPSVNPDGAHYSFYNFQSQRKNMTNWCVNGAAEGDDPMAADFWTPRTNPGTGALYTQTDPGSRNAWGVDLNRNQTEGTIWDGYVGASHSCNSEVYAGPGEASEPEAKNEAWIVDTFSNIKFSNNVHTSGGYFMWAPGAYQPSRETLPAPNIGIEKYFFAAAETVLGRIAEYRGNVVLPQRTGPIADVLYSAAGNSADDNYYRKGIIGYSFEAGSDLFVTPTLTQPAAAGATGIRVSSTSGMAANDYITIGWNGPSPEIRRIASIVNAPNPNPNVMLTGALASDHAAGEQVNGGTAAQGVGFFPPYEAEGQHEANEFANGNYGLLEAALAYSRDKTAPLVNMTGDRISSGDPIRTTFEYVNEPSVIHYTTDGTMPTFESPMWERQGLRRPGEVFEFSENTTVRWLALDLAGNTSRGVARFSIGEQYEFGGFRSPVSTGVNERTAGATVPVKFAITGHSDPSDVTDIYSEKADCETQAAEWTGVGSPAESFSAVTVDPRNQLYQVDWKTSKTWKGTCRALILVLSDNTEHSAFFRFK